ncbi:hypothetical protein H0E87_031645, partial [Populus deltoides]
CQRGLLRSLYQRYHIAHQSSWCRSLWRSAEPFGGLPEVSHCTPIQLVQKPLEDTLEQPDGKGFRELASFSMTATSLAVTDERMRRKLR